ncbi:adenosylcobinamide-phosphate synthase CbiB [Neofamilia massiliensis]|uniref:adenosylcobinamide-phosphate synthase CbiB n=1 Tax=Neofamilia massiliensis TaxID=1673724 RepID=UPI0006BB6D02|nr:adenosylcobinamide-phosphate synthase CbiB [Neofamilia massiliensis]
MILIFIAVAIDWIVGDPYFLPHPIRLMGSIIAFEERFFKKYFSTKTGLEFAGLLIVLINISLAIFPMYFIFSFLGPRTKNVLTVIIYYYCISARMLHYEAMEVKKALDISLEAGRERVKYIVGRDTENLNENGVVRATVETVAENTSDGIIAPLFYMVIFGPLGGLTYKFVNTMDSMIAYKNERYIHIGRAAAIVDDIFNYIPARLTGLLMALTNIYPKKIVETLKDIKKFARHHSSPNAGYPESAVASILGVQLGGGQFYKGLWVEKPKIGYEKNFLTRECIFSTIKVMYKTEILFLIFYFVISIIF